MAWSPEQIANARSIIQVGRSLGASDRDITIALMAAWQESSMRNLSYGDRDSVGLFQQRNAWGSRADRMDPVKSARMFFLGGAQGQRGLLDFANRDSYGLGQAAQKVQVSAFPDAYDKWQNDSEELLKELGGSVGKPAGGGSTTGTIPAADPTASEKELLGGLGGQAALPPSSPLGLDSPAGTDSNSSAAGAAPGIEAADQQPNLMPSIDQSVEELLKTDNPTTGGGGAQLPVNDTGDLSKRIQYSGVTLDMYTYNRLQAAEKALGYNIRLSQGSYNKGGVAASAGTHDGGGAMDVSIRGRSQSQINAIVSALRSAGFAAWYRTADQGKWSPHIHAVAIGNPWLSPEAARQVTDFQHGGDGLAN